MGVFMGQDGYMDFIMWTLVEIKLLLFFLTLLLLFGSVQVLS